MSQNLRGENNPFFGKKHSDETKSKLSASTASFTLRGELNPWWNGGTGGRYWRNKALIRDNFTCTICGLYDPEIMQVDHIKPKVLNPELSHSLENLRCLCPNCHERKSRAEKRARYDLLKERPLEK